MNLVAKEAAIVSRRGAGAVGDGRGCGAARARCVDGLRGRRRRHGRDARARPRHATDERRRRASAGCARRVREEDLRGGWRVSCATWPPSPQGGRPPSRALRDTVREFEPEPARKRRRSRGWLVQPVAATRAGGAPARRGSAPPPPARQDAHPCLGHLRAAPRRAPGPPWRRRRSCAGACRAERGESHRVADVVAEHERERAARSSSSELGHRLALGHGAGRPQLEHAPAGEADEEAVGIEWSTAVGHGRRQRASVRRRSEVERDRGRLALDDEPRLVISRGTSTANRSAVSP